MKLFVFAFFCTLAQFLLGLDATGFGSPFEAATVARNLSATGEFRDPFGIHTGPTAHVPPVYPAILAVIMRLFKDPAHIVWAAVLLNAVLIGFTAALLPALSARIYASTMPGYIAAVLFTLSGRLMPQWEVALAALLLLVATLAFLDLGPLSAGLWAGACLLTNPVSLPSLAVIAIPRGKRWAAAAFGLALAVCLPWILRNWINLGAPYFIRDNLGLELYISNNDKAAPKLIDNTALWTEHPNQNHDEAVVVARMGEGPYNQMRLHDALLWIRSHPIRFVQLTAGRALNYWLPTPREGWPAWGAWFITVFGVAGAWFARRNRKSVLLAAAALAYSLPYLFIQTVGRYRYPSLWMTALLAGHAVEVILSRYRLAVNFRQRPLAD